MVRKSKHNRYRFCRIILALALSIPFGLVAPLTPPEPVEAGIGAWTSDGPYGGNIQDIAYSPGFAQDRTVFVATTQGVFKSTNGGDSWLRASRGISMSHVTSLAVTPNYTASQTLFAGTMGGGVFKSKDGGESWAATNTGLNDLNANTLAIAPTYPLTPILIVGTVSGVYRSEDGGNSWQYCNYIEKLIEYDGPVVNDIAFSPNYAQDQTVFLGTPYGPLRSLWGGRDWIGPPKRGGHSAIYDAAHQRMIVFGGYDYDNNWQYFNDVWALDLSVQDNERWIQINPSGTAPSKRDAHSAIYDAANQRMLVYGGDVNGTYDNDVWALDLRVPGAEAWTQLSLAVSPPSGRRFHSAIYDTTNQRMLVFGGYSDGYHNDVWALDVSTPGAETWTQLNPSGVLPLEREKHTAIYDAANQRMIVFGGEYYDNDWHYFNDIWALDLSIPGAEAWIQLNPSGILPSERYGHTAIYDTMHQQMLIFGGNDFNDNNVWKLSLGMLGFERWEPYNLTGESPSARQSHSAIYDTTYARMFIFGASEDGLWSLELIPLSDEHWVNLSADKILLPSGHVYHSAIYDAFNMQMIVFGFGHTWALDLTVAGAESWIDLNPAGVQPSGIYYHSAIYDPTHKRMIAFDGEAMDTWALDLSIPGMEAWSQLQISGAFPPPRSGHSVIYDAAHQRMIIFGGYNNLDTENHYNDVWALDLSVPGAETWTELTPTGILPNARFGHSAIYDAMHQRMIVYGGEDESFTSNNDVWALDLSTPGAESWVQLNPNGTLPPMRTLHSATYDAIHQRMIVFGGLEYVNHDTNVWILDLSLPGAETWRQLAMTDNTTPSERWGHSAIYDAFYNRMIIFGGGYSEIQNDMWVLDLTAAEQSNWSIPNNTRTIALSPSFFADGTVLISTPADVLKSSNGGKTWAAIGNGLPEGERVQTVTFSTHYLDNRTIFAGTQDGIYRSFDGGSTWGASNNGLSALDIQALAVSPVYQEDTTLFTGTGGNLYRSPNGGLGWLASNVGLEAVNVEHVAISPGFESDHTVFAGGETGIYKSTAEGMLWTPVNHGVTSRQVNDVVLSPVYPGDQTLFAATDEAVFRSGDGGGIWASFSNGLDTASVRRLRISPNFAVDKTVFAVLNETLGMQRSTDGGGHWTPPELNEFTVNYIALSPAFATDGRVWVATKSGIFTTITGRDAWQGWPTGRSAHSTIYDMANQRMIVFGANLWVLDLNTRGAETWAPLSLSGTQPTARSFYSAVYDAPNERMIVFGGYLNDVWSLDLSTPGVEAWTQLHPSGMLPTARNDHSAIYDAVNARMIVFGGYSSTGRLNDVWVLDLSTPGTETWTRLSPLGDSPSARGRHSAIYDAVNARMIVSGGNSNSGYLNDVWALDLSTPGVEAWAQLSPSGTLPTARNDHSAIYDAANAQMIVFGGYYYASGSHYLNDVWGLDLSTPGAEIWAQLGPSGTLPTARYDHSAIYDAENERMIIFGGYSLNDVWSLDLGTPGAESWIQRLPNADYRVGEHITLLAASPGFSTDQTLFLVSADQLYRSTNAGVNWTALATLPGITDLQLSPAYASDHTLYAVAGGEVHRSTDGGATWTALSAGLGANSVSVTPDGQSWTLFAATTSGVWRYTFPQPENVRTLILTHQARLHARYGAAADTLLQKLYTLAEHPAVEGLVVDLGDADAFPEVAAAYAAWDAAPPISNTYYANQVALAVRDVIGTYVDAYPNIHYLVLVGHDEVIPFHRLPDGTAADALPYADYALITGTVALALAEGMTLSDDPYASLHPLTLSGDATLYVPDLSAGRLVESPDDIGATIDAFLLRSEINEHALAFVSGADYALMDSAYAIADTLQAANLVSTTLIGNGWTASDLALPLLAQDYDLVSLNQHAYHDKLLAPDNTYLTPQDVLSATGDLAQTLVYAVGCHAGLSLPDAPNGSLGLDFPQAFAQRGAPLVANTGYGWATRYAVGLTERLALYFSQALAPAPGSTTTIGQALRDAKRRYYLAAWRFDAYDAKVLNEMTLYGLPMYTLSTPIGPSQPVSTPLLPTTPVTITYAAPDTQTLSQITNDGLRTTDYELDGTHTTVRRAQSVNASLPPFVTQASIQFQFPQENYDVADVGEARYYSYLGEVQANRGMPLLPRFSFGVSIPGARTQGVLFAGGAYSDVFALPVTTTAVISDSLGENPASAYVPGQWYPTVLQLVNQLADGGDDRLTMSLGNMRRGIGPNGEALTTTQRLYNNVAFEVYYYNRLAEGVPDRTPPQVTEVLTDVVAGTVHVSVGVDDVLGAGDTQALGVWRVVVAYTSNASGVGQWESQELAYNAVTQRWEGRITPTPQGANPALLIVQAVDRGGNVTADDNEGWYYQIPASALIVTPPAQAILTGPQHGVVEQPYTFTATAQPLSTTLPLTYTWQATGQSNWLTTTMSLSTTATFAWQSPGMKIITVTVVNAGGVATATHAITVGIPAITITGPLRGAVHTPLTFTATAKLVPSTVILPSTFVWEATDQVSVTHVVDTEERDAMTFTWDATGFKLITVTVTNAGGRASTMYGVDIDLRRIYLPVVMRQSN